MGAYRKLMLHNEVVSGKGANCMNDITKVLHISSNRCSSSKSLNQNELVMIANFDFENRMDCEDFRRIGNNESNYSYFHLYVSFVCFHLYVSICMLVFLIVQCSFIRLFIYYLCICLICCICNN